MNFEVFEDPKIHDFPLFLRSFSHANFHMFFLGDFGDFGGFCKEFLTLFGCLGHPEIGTAITKYFEHLDDEKHILDPSQLYPSPPFVSFTACCVLHHPSQLTLVFGMLSVTCCRRMSALALTSRLVS